jgi:predicted nucleic acid-binding protein
MIGPVVIDTNVLVAGILTGEKEAPTARIVRGMLRRTFHFLLSEELLTEYRRVLLRPAVCRRHGLSESEIDVILGRVARHGIVRECAAPPVRGPHESDAHLFALAAMHPGARVVTGDRTLLEDRSTRPWTLTPAEFAALLE